MPKRGLNLPKEKTFTGPALIWKRILAFLADMLIINLVLFFPFKKLIQKSLPDFASYSEAYGFFVSNPGHAKTLTVVAVIMSIFAVLYFALLEYKTKQTPGKAFFNISIATDAKELRLWQCLLRSLFLIPAFPFFLLWAIDPTFMLFTKSNQRLSEILSKTRTVEIYLMGENMAEEKRGKWGTFIKVILILLILSFIASWFVSIFTGTADFKRGNVALIPIKGLITSEKIRTFGEEVSSSDKIIEFIEDADRNPEIKAVILEINSPGGAPVASEEIANAVERVNKTTIAVIREIGTSGAYWIASASDKIIASRMSLTGSIGVIASYIQLSGLLKDYNVTYERLVGGRYKDIGSPFKPLTVDERELFQKQIDKLHAYFIREVAKNRNLSEEKVRELATGMFYTGEEAKELGLIDFIGGKEEAKAMIEKQLNITAKIVEYREERRLIDLLSELFSEQSFFVGKGIGSSVLETRNSNRLEVLT